jgi:hypothetical protein
MLGGIQKRQTEKFFCIFWDETTRRLPMNRLPNLSQNQSSQPEKQSSHGHSAIISFQGHSAIIKAISLDPPWLEIKCSCGARLGARIMADNPTSVKDYSFTKTRSPNPDQCPAIQMARLRLKMTPLPEMTEEQKELERLDSCFKCRILFKFGGKCKKHINDV